MAVSGNAASGRKRIAILGGGAAAMGAAFWLSAPAIRDRFQVTVYTQGWRLGGKCATGRNCDRNNRIEEHGLHILMGCYENAFRTLRACYDEWQPGPECPFKSWKDAFVPQRDVALMEQDGPGDPPGWQARTFTFPELPGQPGSGGALRLDIIDHLSGHTRDSQLHMAVCDWLKTFLTTHFHPHILAGFENACTDCYHAIRRGLHLADEPPHEPLAQLNRRIQDAVAQQDNPVVPGSGPSWRLLWHLANIGMAIVVGLASDALHYAGQAYEHRNSLDLRAWLRQHGATDAALASAPIRALYELTFAFPDGDTSDIDKGRIAAGAALRFMLEATLGYKTAPLWEMQAGMGETVFTPLYQVLSARGVNIELFHRVKDLRLDDQGRIASVLLHRQAAFCGPGYDPFVRVNGLDCWPWQPNWAQLQDGAALQARGVDFEAWHDDTHVGQRVLQQGADFDLVVLATPPEVVRRVTPQLAQHSADWANMIDRSASVATQAMQLWMTPTAPDLGWDYGRRVVGAYREAYDSMADMSHLLKQESWAAAGPQMLGYFCGCMPNPPQDPAKARAAAEAQAETWRRHALAGLWPKAMQPDGQFHPGLELDRYIRANVDPSELYVQTPPGNVQHRPQPDQVFFGNLFVVGDWTRTRFSGGCFEAAIESGMRAAAAIGGEPDNIAGD